MFQELQDHQRIFNITSFSLLELFCYNKIWLPTQYCFRDLARDSKRVGKACSMALSRWAWLMRFSRCSSNQETSLHEHANFTPSITNKRVVSSTILFYHRFLARGSIMLTLMMGHGYNLHKTVHQCKARKIVFAWKCNLPVPDLTEEMHSHTIGGR